MSGFGEVIGNLFEKAGSSLLRKSAAPEAESAWRMFGSKADIFKYAGPDGEALDALHKQFQTTHSQTLGAINKPLNELQQKLYETGVTGIRADKTPMSAIAQQLRQTNHPAAGLAHQILNMSPSNAGKTMRDISISNVMAARTLAGAQIFGDKMQNVTPLLVPYLESNDPVKNHWAQTVLDVLSNELHDHTDTRYIRGQVEKGSFSRSKSKVADFIAHENTMRGRLRKAGVADVGPDLKPINVEATQTPRGVGERKISGILRTAQLPMVALKHVSQYGNLSSIHARYLVKGLTELSDPQFRQFLDASGILSFTQHDMMDRFLNGRFGKVASFTNPTAGDLFYRSYHMPFFDFLRTRQLTFAASVGYHATTDWAAAAMHGDKRAIAELTEMGFDPKKIIAQGGVLTNEQKVHAMFHFVNNRFFMDKSIERSLLSNSNMWFRSATMYHTFVNAQQKFIRRELGKMFKSGDYVGIAQFAGTIGILWPAVAPMVKGLEVFGRTANYDQAKQGVEDDYDKIWNGSFGDKTHTYLDLLAHYGAFGVYTSYVQAAKTDRFGYQILGPQLGTLGRGASDLFNTITVTNKAGKHNAAPLVRDVLEDTIPIAGNLMAHHLVPTKKEQGSHGKPGRPHRSRGSSNAWEFELPGDL